MTIRIRESDSVGTSVLDASEPSQLDELDWDADPALILERMEQEFGINCFDQPIN